MTLTYKEFVEQIAALYAFGMPRKDDWELDYWHRAIAAKELTPAQLGAAVFKITQEQTKFWDTDNIPAKIIEMAAQIQFERNQAALSERLRLEDTKARAERKQIEEEVAKMSDEEREGNKAKIQKMIKECFYGGNSGSSRSPNRIKKV